MLLIAGLAGFQPVLVTENIHYTIDCHQDQTDSVVR